MDYFSEWADVLVSPGGFVLVGLAGALLYFNSSHYQTKRRLTLILKRRCTDRPFGGHWRGFFCGLPAVALWQFDHQDTWSQHTASVETLCRGHDAVRQHQEYQGQAGYRVEHRGSGEGYRTLRERTAL